MKFCTNCGVELEAFMNRCPLCGKAVSTGEGTGEYLQNQSTVTAEGQPPVSFDKIVNKQKKIVWEVFSIILVSGAIVTLLINFLFSKHITWAEIPATICLLIFFYVSLFTFWKGSLFVKISIGFIAAVVFLWLLHLLSGKAWPLGLAAPLVFIGNLITVLLILIIHHLRNKGINLIAYFLIGCAFFCIGIEAVVSLYHNQSIHLSWSPIVLLCILLVAIVLLFLHFRLRKGTDLKRDFHI